VEGLTLQDGDVIEVNGARDSGEWVRIDKLVLTDTGARTTDDGNTYLGQFDTERVEKTFTLGEETISATVTFDFLEIDSWDGERFLIYVNGQEIDLGGFNWQSDEVVTRFTASGIPVIKDAATDLSGYGGSAAHWASNDSLHRVTLTVEDPGETLTLGFSSTLNQGIKDESWGIDNLSITTVKDMSEDAFVFGGSTYELGTAGLTWEAARAEAEAKGGKIVTIDSAEENQFIFETFGTDVPVWLGLTDTATEGSFVGTDGSAAAYTNWLPGEPNNFGSGQDYAAMSSSTGQWDDISNAGGSFYDGSWSGGHTNVLVIEYDQG